MSVTLILACLWVIAGAAVACLPMRFQYIPGVLLLLAAPVLIFLIGRDHGLIAVALAVFALVSMFRRPLKYFAARAVGRNPEVPK